MVITSIVAVGCITINIFILGHGSDGQCAHGHSHGGGNNDNEEN